MSTQEQWRKAVEDKKARSPSPNFQLDDSSSKPKATNITKARTYQPEPGIWGNRPIPTEYR